ncbi:MAG: glutamate--tRNA ligase [Bacteroidota bacterium]
MTNKKVRVRFAPSPTGPLHIGGVRTALYNYLFAKKHDGDFILRIEDTDQARYVPEAEEYIVESLKWCNINFNESPGHGGNYAPYRQSERKEMYWQYAEQLVNDGHAYYAFDTPEELDEIRKQLKTSKNVTFQYDASTRNSLKNSLSLSEDDVNKRLQAGESYVIRIKIPENREIRVRDLIRGLVVVHSSIIDDKVLFKSDGMPTYHLANVVDDHLMKISHVIRGEEWLPSTPLHVLLYRYLGWEQELPEFAHLPLLLRPDGAGKLSKRDGDRLGFPVFPLEWTDPETSEISSGFREIGYFPEAFVNILAFLGWNPGTTQELFNMDELTEAFSLERVGKGGAKFDPEKAKWYNQQYLRAQSKEKLIELFQPLLKETGIKADNEYVAKVCELMKERVTFVKDIIEHLYFFFAPEIYDQNVIRKKWREETPSIINKLKELLEGIDDFTAGKIEKKINTFLEEKGIGFGAVMPNFRVLITGTGSGPSMFDIVALLGKEETIKRINKGLQQLNKEIKPWEKYH